MSKELITDTKPVFLGAIMCRRNHFGALLRAVMCQRCQIQGPHNSRNVPKGSFWSFFWSYNIPKGSFWGLLRSNNVSKGSIGHTKPTLSATVFNITPLLEFFFFSFLYSFSFSFSCFLSFSFFFFICFSLFYSFSLFHFFFLISFS